jgi:hypothetical protein
MVMRAIGRLLLVVGTCLTAGPVQADPNALAVLDRAIKAQGGEAALSKALRCARSESGALVRPGKDVPFTREVVRSLPERWRSTLDVARGPQVVTVVTADKGWQRAAGPTVELPKERLRELREEAYVWWLTTLVPLKKGGVTLSLLPESKVDGAVVVGVRVVRAGHADANLYFSKSNGLLVKISRRLAEAGAVVEKEHLFSDYKDFAGVKLPSREVVTIDGRRFTDTTLRDCKFPARIEDSAFVKP